MSIFTDEERRILRRYGARRHPWRRALGWLAYSLLCVLMGALATWVWVLFYHLMHR